MNCRKFNAVLLEYLDGTLASKKIVEARRHLVSCSECRQSVQQERALAESLTQLMHDAANPLTLHPAVKRRILEAFERDIPHTAIADELLGLWRRFLSLKFAAASLGIIVVLIGLVFLESIRPRLESNRLGSIEGRSALSIRMSCSTAQYTFRQEGDLIFDNLGIRTNTVNVTVWTAETAKSPRKYPKNTMRL